MMSELSKNVRRANDSWILKTIVFLNSIIYNLSQLPIRFSIFLRRIFRTQTFCVQECCGEFIQMQITEAISINRNDTKKHLKGIVFRIRTTEMLETSLNLHNYRINFVLCTIIHSTIVVISKKFATCNPSLWIILMKFTMNCESSCNLFFKFTNHTIDNVYKIANQIVTFYSFLRSSYSFSLFWFIVNSMYCLTSMSMFLKSFQMKANSNNRQIFE